LSGLKDVGISLSELKSAVGDIFNDPIKGFGVLSGYVSKRLRESTGFGNDRIVSQLPNRLKPAAAIYEKYVVELSKASDALLRMHGKEIAEEQYQLKRLADVVIDLFVGLATLARADALSREGPHGDEAVQIAALFAQQAKRRMAANIRALLRNEDHERDQLASFVLKQGRFPWDVV
jgi:acyl-CoA dehydrogenase family member 9